MRFLFDLIRFLYHIVFKIDEKERKRLFGSEFGSPEYRRRKAKRNENIIGFFTLFAIFSIFDD